MTADLTNRECMRLLQMAESARESLEKVVLMHAIKQIPELPQALVDAVVDCDSIVLKLRKVAKRVN